MFIFAMYDNSCNDSLGFFQNFNRTGRAYPDISALSDNFWIIINRLVG